MASFSPNDTGNDDTVNDSFATDDTDVDVTRNMDYADETRSTDARFRDDASDRKADSRRGGSRSPQLVAPPKPKVGLLKLIDQTGSHNQTCASVTSQDTCEYIYKDANPMNYHSSNFPSLIDRLGPSVNHRPDVQYGIELDISKLPVGIWNKPEPPKQGMAKVSWKPSWCAFL